MEYQTIRCETPEPAIRRIVLARPESRNAQSRQMTYELNRAFDQAARDVGIKVIILSGDGPHFCSGHDLRDQTPVDTYDTVFPWGGFEAPGAEGRQAREEEIYFQMCWRWRNIPKPTIAQVHGKTIAGGLMLAWVCDLIVASQEATFSDPVVAFGVNGVEYFGHPWELGARKAKELLFTGGMIGAEDARMLGMVNHVVAREDLDEFALSLARRIAERPAMGLRLAKQSVNQTQDAQGFWTALQAAMSLQQLGHSHNAEVFGRHIDPRGIDVIRRDAKG